MYMVLVLYEWRVVIIDCIIVFELRVLRVRCVLCACAAYAAFACAACMS